MNVCIISPFFLTNSNISRPGFIRKVLKEHGCNTLTITSDFSHQAKEKVEFSDEDIVTLRTLKYNNNKSPVRFISHLLLALSFFIYAFKKRNLFDVFYITAPFALSALLVKVFIRKKVVIDIVDFWPESLPFGNYSIMGFILIPWRWVNYIAFGCVDRVISLSSSFISSAGLTGKAKQILLGSTASFTPRRKLCGSLSIFYIGNIGSLYDFETLISAMESYQGKVNLEIVGTGDRVDWLLKTLDERGCCYQFHGAVYDESRIFDIASLCDVGFNGYINTNASFSYKASSYFKFGLPIINSMTGDLKFIVDEYLIGVNYTCGDVISLVNAMNRIYLEGSDYKNNTINYFKLNLDYTIVAEEIINVFEGLK